MTPFQTSKGSFLAVDVPEGSDVEVFNEGDTDSQLLLAASNRRLHPVITLPPGSYQFLFCTKGCSEEQAGMVVGVETKKISCIKFLHFTLACNKLDPEKNLAILKQG